MVERSVLHLRHAATADLRLGLWLVERRMAKVLQTLKLLPRVERDVLAVCVFAGLDYQAAAAALGIPVGTVRSRLSRARSHLKRLSAQVTGDNPGEEHKP